MTSAATRTPARRLRRTAAWLLAMSLPVGVVTGGAGAFAAAPAADYELVGSSVGALGAPSAVVVDANGVVFVADTARHVVHRIVNGVATVVAGVADEVGLPADGKLDNPAALALSSDGKTLYIADTGSDVVVTVDATATPGATPAALTLIAGVPGVPGAPTNVLAKDSKLNDPSGLAFDVTGNLYVADAGNNQIERINKVDKKLEVVAGTGQRSTSTAGLAVDSALNKPAAVAVDASGTLFVADSGNRSVVKYDPTTRQLAPVGSTGSAGFVTSLSLDLSGTVFFTDPTGGGLKKLVSGVPSSVSLSPSSTTSTSVSALAGGNLWVADLAGSVGQFKSTATAAAPRITSTAPTAAAAGKVFTHRFTATGTPTPVFSFVDTKGPDGLTLNAGTGVLSGTPKAAGTLTFTVRAANSAGHEDQVITLTVGALPAAPAAPTAVAGDSKAVVTFKPAATTGTTTSDVTGYVLTPYKDGVAQTPVTYTTTQASTQIVTGLTNGAKYTFTLAAKNAFGTGVESPISTAVTPYATLKKPVLDTAVSRQSGKDRLETSVNSSKALFPTAGSAGAVVVSAGYKYADALAGARLASATSAPLLLTESDKLTAAVGTEISRVLAPGGTIYVLGGSGTVSSGVETALTALSPNNTVKRLAGDDRFETAGRIADEVAAQAAGTDTAPIYLASGVNFPDGLAVSALAARTGGVVLLTDGDVMPAATAAYLKAKDANGSRVVPVGGAAAAAAKSLPASGGSSGRAIVGTDRFDTANLVARTFVGGATVTKAAGVATGDNWPDALVGAAAMGLLGGPLLLTSGTDLSPAAQSALTALNTAKPLATGVVFGGEPSVSATAYASFTKNIAQD